MCIRDSNIMCVCASSEDSTNFFNENKTGSSEHIQKETPKNIETNPSGYMQTNNSKNASSESSNYTETETPENTQIKSSQNTKTESSEYQIKSSENDQNCVGAPRCKQRGMSAPALSFTVFLIKVDYFHLLICLLFFLVSLILNIICDNIGSCSIPYCSNISSITPKFPTPKLFSNFRIFFENFPCCYAFYNLHNS